MKRLDVKKLMALEEQEEYEAILRFRKTPMGKLITQGRKENIETICLTPNGFITELEKHNKSRYKLFILDESSFKGDTEK